MNRKYILSILACLMILGGLAAASINTVKAQGVTEPIIMWAVIGTDPYDGYYGGYHDVMYAIKDELIKIGIDMRIVTQDSATWWDTVWESKWNVTGTAYGDPGTYDYGYDGWDISIDGWWLNPTSYIWLDEVVLGRNMPPDGYNIHSWVNPKADDYYIKAQTTTDPVAHKNYMDLWQAEFMHDCPVVILYYNQEKVGAQASYLDGYDPGLGWYTRAYYSINQTKFYEVLPADDPTWATRRAIGPDTLLWGADHPIWSFFPLFVLSYTEEHDNVMTLGMVYRSSRENMAAPGFPTGKYTVEPELAARLLTATDWSLLPDGRWAVDIPLRQGITWTDGVPFNASDFAFTVNAVINPLVHGYGYRSYYLWDHAEVVAPYTARIVYKPGLGPDNDLAGYMAHGWAWGMLPWHQLKDTDPRGWKVSIFATDPFPDSSDGPGGDHLGLERLGPYIPIEWDPKTSTLKLQLRPEYCEAAGINNDRSAIGITTPLPTYYVVKWIPLKPPRFVALQKLEIDYCEYPTASVTAWKSMMTWPTHKVNTGFFFMEDPTLWLNKRNPILSNRYVRLAIAHAIPYPKIESIVYGWGVNQTRPGKSFVFPIVDDFNTALGNYVYDIDKAKAYMDKWRYSQKGTDYTKGPLGDHDFSGFVEMPDFPIWARWYGTYSSKDPLYPYPDKWPHTPGNDRDADNDNNGFVETKDFPMWASNFGKRYGEW